MKTIKLAVACILAWIAMSGVSHATPSTTYWTPTTTDIQSFGVLHFTYDTYFKVVRDQTEGGEFQFPVDVGLTLGVLPFEKLQMEVGVDLLEPTADDALFFNAKIGTPEGALFSGSPAVNLGVFGIGTGVEASHQDIGFAVIGKTIPVLGRLFVGYYHGNSVALKDAKGETDNHGLMFAFDHGFLPKKDAAGNEYNRVVLAADYATGNNAIGGGGVGVYYYFTKDVSLLTGPVWFNPQPFRGGQVERVNGDWKWTLQLDINQGIF